MTRETPAIEAGRVRLRAIGPGDLEDLRRWKNDNREAFFFEGTISAEDQKRWYAGYLERADDVMFVVESGGEKAGCIGARLDGDEVDVYNVIADTAYRGKGLMKTAVLALCGWIRGKWVKPIRVLVKEDNDVLGFYYECGFTESEILPHKNCRKLCLGDGR
jgi:ribosomal protein S18 acetylase RimI-like enzyme